MKRLIFIFAFLLCCSAIQANARGIMTMCGAGVPVAGCTTPTGDELTESFGDASTSCWSGGDSLCNNTWTVANGSPSIANVPAGAPDNTACTKGLRVETSGGAVLIRRDLGDGTIPNNVQTVFNFTLYTDSSSIAAWNISRILSFTQSTNADDANNYFSLRLERYTGTTGSANRILIGGTTCRLEVADDNWYNVTITLDAAGAENGSSMAIAGGGTCNFTRKTAASRYLNIGTVNTSMDYYIGNIRISTP